MSVDMQKSLKDLQIMVSELADVEDIKEVVTKILGSGVSPVDVAEAMSGALRVVGERYEKGDYFLSELIMAGIIATEITDAMEPYFEKTANKGKTTGKIVIGTVRGDLHDIGKNILITMFSSGGFRVVDLGIDVPCERFMEAVEKERPDILAMSCLLTVAMDELRKVIEELSRVGLRGKVKVMVGGRPITPKFAKEIGADAYCSNAIEAVEMARDLVEVIPSEK